GAHDRVGPDHPGEGGPPLLRGPALHPAVKNLHALLPSFESSCFRRTPPEMYPIASTTVADQERPDQYPTVVSAASTFSVTPETLAPSSEARNTAAAAMSAPVASRLSGVRSRRASQPWVSMAELAPGVTTGTGARAFTRMPWAPSSTACWRVRVSSAPLMLL